MRLLGDYFRATGVRACVVPVSGGVDSAVALGLLKRLLDAPASPLEDLVAVLLPVSIAEGVTNQPQATARGRAVADALGVRWVEADLGAGHDAVRQSVEAGLGVEGSPWAAGQLVSTLRSPAVYYAATLLTDGGTPCVVCGTTNRDEGAYLGFFGKGSDAMVDVQPISDLHKSEVYALARLLGVPQATIEAAPAGTSSTAAATRP